MEVQDGDDAKWENGLEGSSTPFVNADGSTSSIDLGYLAFGPHQQGRCSFNRDLLLGVERLGLG